MRDNQIFYYYVNNIVTKSCVFYFIAFSDVEADISEHCQQTSLLMSNQALMIFHTIEPGKMLATKLIGSMLYAFKCSSMHFNKYFKTYQIKSILYNGQYIFITWL